ncbi:hypothetical protein SARC_16483, partial [Sphaeroforma arctica JP610]
GLEDVAANMIVLNDNMESLLVVGQSFETIGKVWGEFHQVVTKDEDKENNSYRSN